MERVYCCDCVHYDDMEDSPGFGRCRVNPPHATHDGDGVWPIVEECDWCGRGKRSGRLPLPLVSPKE